VRAGSEGDDGTLEEESPLGTDRVPIGKILAQTVFEYLKVDNKPAKVDNRRVKG
jgi:hypothetical protein